MTSERSREAFMAFLEHVSEKGLIPENTAASRRATAGKVFEVLSAEEAQDVLSLDIDAVLIRFENKYRGKYTSESLQTYRSRLKNSLNDFGEFIENPFAFKPRRRFVVKVKGGTAKSSAIATLEETNAAAPSASQAAPSVHVLPIALRPSLTVQIAGLPFDLTSGEAKKIANIILAHVAPSEQA